MTDDGWQPVGPADGRGEPAEIPDALATSALPEQTSAVRHDGEEITFSPRELMRLYLARDWDALTESFLILLSHFGTHNRLVSNPGDQAFVDSLAENLLFFLARPAYEIPPRHGISFLRMQPEVANLVAMSRFRTTDPQLHLILAQAGRGLRAGSLAKLLTLFNPRCSARIDRKSLFDIHPLYASVWYAMYFCSCEFFATELTHRNLTEHVAGLDDRYVLFGEEAAVPYFTPTYVDFDAEPRIRRVINRAAQAAQRDVVVTNRPRPGRIAVITSRWKPTTSVYRSIYPFVHALQGHYDMTLVHLGAPREGDDEIDADLFSDVRRVDFRRGSELNLTQVADNDFELAYFVDVGLHRESIFLSNLRLAPIQVTGYGHPVSTFGAKMDYFIGGADVELAERAKQHYSERLVLIPGIGLHPVWPEYRRQGTPKDTDAILINCPWTPMKINHPLLEALKEIARRGGRKVEFMFFATVTSARVNSYLPFCRDLRSVLGEGLARIEPSCGVEDYFRRVEMADLTLTSYPFGGYNIVLDSLYLGKPIVTREGDRFCNRAAAQLLRRAGLEELVAQNEAEYIEKTVRLIQDDQYRAGFADRLARIDLKSRIYDTSEPRYFKKAVDYIISHHDQLQTQASREPIFIS